MNKRDYKTDALIAIFEMNVRYQYFGNHPWIKETIIPANDFQRKLYAETNAKVERAFRRMMHR